MLCRFHILILPYTTLMTVLVAADRTTGDNHSTTAAERASYSSTASSAASETAVGKRKNLHSAILDIFLLKYSNGSLVSSQKSIQLNAMFGSVGTIAGVDGYLRQVHPCQSDENFRDWTEMVYSWIAVYKLEDPKQERSQCKNIIKKAKLALSKGASAVIFDVRDNRNASKELKQRGVHLGKPILLIHGTAAKKLQEVIRRNLAATIKISTMISGSELMKSTEVHKSTVNITEADSRKDFGNIILFVSIAAIFGISAITAVAILKFRRRNGSPSRIKSVKKILNRMNTLEYQGILNPNIHREDHHLCVICLLDYIVGQELRILQCSHTFHKCCVDVWLLSKRTCPLCKFDIADVKKPKKKKCFPAVLPGSVHHVLQVEEDNNQNSQSLSSFGSQSALTRSTFSLNAGESRDNDDVTSHNNHALEYSFNQSKQSCSGYHNNHVYNNICQSSNEEPTACNCSGQYVEKLTLPPTCIDNFGQAHLQNNHLVVQKSSSGYDADISSVDTVGSTSEQMVTLISRYHTELGNCSCRAECGSDRSDCAISFRSICTDDCLPPVHLKPACLDHCLTPVHLQPSCLDHCPTIPHST